MPSWSMRQPLAGYCRSPCSAFLQTRGFHCPGARWRASYGLAARCVCCLGVALTAVEWLRGHLLTGFPWNAFGYALTTPLVLAQAALIGIWGLTFIAVVVCATPATLVDDRAETQGCGCRWHSVSRSLLEWVLSVRYGLVRAPTHFVDGVELGIMEPIFPSRT